MNNAWLYARSLAEIIAHRESVLAGVADVAHDDIVDEIGNGDESDETLERLWFDRCADDLAENFDGGAATVHRAISVDDMDAFLAATALGAPLGSHWTTDAGRATTCLHGGEWRRHDILLTGRVEAGAVDGGTTFQQRFAHPCEMEVFVDGEVTLLGVVRMDTGEDLPWGMPGSQ